MGDGVFNAVVGKVSLYSEYGNLHLAVEMDYGGRFQAFGAYTVYAAKQFDHAGLFLKRLLEVAGADDWSRLAGRPVRVRRENGLIAAVGHFIDDDWFCPKEVFGGD